MRYFARIVMVTSVAIAGLLVLAACGSDPTATPPPTPTSVTSATATPVPTGQEEYEQLIIDAEEEGELTVISGFSSQAQILGWEKAFPDIKLNFTQLRAPDLVARLPAEQAAGKFEWDIVFIGGSGGVDPTIPRTLFEPVRDKIILEELLQDSTWVGGFDQWWMDDDERRFKFHHKSSASIGTAFDVNRDVAPDFNSAEDFFRPEFKGKICSFDPRIESGTDSGLAQMMAMFGEDWLKRFFSETDLVFARSGAQLAQDLIAGKYAVCIGASMDQFRREGAGQNVERVFISNPDQPLHADFQWLPVTCCGSGKGNADGPVDGWISGGAAYSNVQVGKNPPHAKAAQLFVNWVLTREGAMAFEDPTDTNCSVRRDLHYTHCVNTKNSIPDQFQPIDPNGSYTENSLASTVKIRIQARDLAVEAFGR